MSQIGLDNNLAIKTKQKNLAINKQWTVAYPVETE